MASTVGSFSIAMDGSVTGPADYMACPQGFADIKTKMEPAGGEVVV